MASRPVLNECDTPVSVGGATTGDNSITEDRRETSTANAETVGPQTVSGC